MPRVRDTILVENDSAAFIAGLPHRILETQEMAGNDRKPTVVLIHGRHGDERVPWIFARTIPEDWFLISPRAIEFEPETPQHETGYSWITMPEKGWPTIDAFDDAVEALHDFILSLPELYPVDPEEIYLLGFSQGAAAAAVLALEHPELVKGIAFLVGFVPEPEITDGQLQGLPIFMAVGSKDERIPLDVSHQSRELLSAAGAKLEYHLYETGHKLNSDGMKDLKRWWLQFLSPAATE